MDIVIPVIVAGAAAASGLWKVLSKQGRRAADAPRQLWLDRFPGDEVQDMVTSEDNRFGLVETSWGCGVVRFRDGAAWRLTDVDIDTEESGLRINLRDVATPRLHLRLPEETAALWYDRIRSV